MKQLVLVFVGGGFGSIARYLLAKYFNSEITGIPYGTFLANVLGSLLIGIILGLAAKNEATFSTFAYENHVFLKSGDFMNFFLYAVGSFVLGFAAVFFGMFLVRYM